MTSVDEDPSVPARCSRANDVSSIETSFARLLSSFVSFFLSHQLSVSNGITPFDQWFALLPPTR